MARHKTLTLQTVNIGAIMQYVPRTSQLTSRAIVRVVAESRTGWFVIERVTIDGCAVRRHVKAKNLSR
jgi:hypothetical protein